MYIRMFILMSILFFMSLCNIVYVYIQRPELEHLDQFLAALPRLQRGSGELQLPLGTGHGWTHLTVSSAARESCSFRWELAMVGPI